MGDIKTDTPHVKKEFGYIKMVKASLYYENIIPAAKNPTAAIPAEISA